MSNVTSLFDKAKTEKHAMNMLAALSAGPEARKALELVLPGMTDNQQRALVAVIAFRMMGGMLPASMELLRRLPQFEDVKPENIGIAFDALVSHGVLNVLHTEGEDASASFVWMGFERLLEATVLNAHAPAETDSDETQQ